MNEQRGNNLIAASRSMSVAPQTELTTAKDMRKALERNMSGGNYGVYCSLVNDRKLRVSGVRLWHGVLQVSGGLIDEQEILNFFSFTKQALAE